MRRIYLAEFLCLFKIGLQWQEIDLSGNDFFEDINNIRDENRRLEEENRRLAEEVSRLEIIRAENTTLRAYMNMVEQHPGHEIVPAYIINRNVTNFSETIVINVGTEDRSTC